MKNKAPSFICLLLLLAFVKDEKGQVTHLILRQGGQDITAKKIK